jgi:hypothetical protein
MDRKTRKCVQGKVDDTVLFEAIAMQIRKLINHG